MGYRSDVGIVFKKSDENLFYDKVREWDASHIGEGESVKEILDYANKETLYSDSLKEDCVVLSWMCVKWYDTYPAVKFFEDVKKYIDIDMDFIRIGEEFGDIEDDSALGAGIVSYYTEAHLTIEDSLVDERY